MTEFISNNLRTYLGRQTSIKELCCDKSKKASYDTWCREFNAKIYPNPTPDIKVFQTCYTKNKVITVTTWTTKIKEAKGEQSIRPN